MSKQITLSRESALELEDELSRALYLIRKTLNGIKTLRLAQTDTFTVPITIEK